MPPSNQGLVNEKAEIKNQVTNMAPMRSILDLPLQFLCFDRKKFKEIVEIPQRLSSTSGCEQGLLSDLHQLPENHLRQLRTAIDDHMSHVTT